MGVCVCMSVCSRWCWCVVFRFLWIRCVAACRCENLVESMCTSRLWHCMLTCHSVRAHVHNTATAAGLGVVQYPTSPRVAPWGWQYRPHSGSAAASASCRTRGPLRSDRARLPVAPRLRFARCGKPNRRSKPVSWNGGGHSHTATYSRRCLWRKERTWSALAK